jgi:class 3 adenylate cyclase
MPIHAWRGGRGKVGAMSTEPEDSFSLPQNHLLADAAAALREGGHWGWVVDAQWRSVYATDETRLTFGSDGELAQWAIGAPEFSPEWVAAARTWLSGGLSSDLLQSFFLGLAPYMLADIGEDRSQLHALVDPRFHSLIEQIAPVDKEVGLGWFQVPSGRGTLRIPVLVSRIRDSAGRHIGSTVIPKPPAGMSTVGAMTSVGDLFHFERMQSVAKPARRPAAILFADLERSTQLARTLPTATYFALGRRLVRVADQCIVDAGGLVGRHVGDGVVAFFLAESAGSDSAASANCINAARSLRAAIDDVAVRSGLTPEDVVLRFGLHWGSTLYVGNITTAGRTEVTALGDEVNEAARIEACATGGKALASKPLLERLDRDDAANLGLDPGSTIYMGLADLPTATDKARRDAPAIAVCEI